MRRPRATSTPTHVNEEGLKERNERPHADSEPNLTNVIHVIEKEATQQQVTEIQEILGSYIKLAVDIERGVLAGGGALHADCEAQLLEAGSQSENVWGADWIPDTEEVRFEALINIRPRLSNPSMTIQSEDIRRRVEVIARSLLEI